MIYLRPDSDIAKSPYEVWLHNGEIAHRFWFRVIKLWTIPTEDVFQTGLKGLLPFVPLTQQGQRREAIERVISKLTQEEADKQRELLSFTYGFASLVFEDESDQQWLRRRFGMLKDILKESWAIKELAQEVAQEVVQEAREEGREEGREEAYKTVLQKQRQTLLSFVQTRFPALMQLAQEQCKAIETSGQMEELLRKVILAQDEQEVRQHLLNVKKEKA